MKSRMVQWVMAATLISGTTMFTSCSNSEDNPTPEPAKKNRTEFIKHTRQNLKEVAENMNFTSWYVINTININFNKLVLLNNNFDKTFSRTFGQEIQKSYEPLPADIAEKVGKKYVATVNLADFDYIFTSTLMGFNVTPNPEDGMIMELLNPSNPQQIARISLKGSGEEYTQYDKRLSNDSVAVIIKYPAHYDYTLSVLEDGNLIGDITVSTDLSIERGEYDEGVPADATDFKKDAWNLKGILKSTIPGDDVEMIFNIGQDPRIQDAGMTFDFTHNNRKIIGLTAEMSNVNGLTDLSQLTSSSSIMDIFSAIMAGNSIDNLQLTLVDDLTTTIKVSDCQKVLKLQNAMSSARRNYADQQTIEDYVAQLNQLVSSSMTCKGVNQQIPMRLATTKIGVDWWAVPALNFADENGYVPLTEMLDKESLEYGINIIDHAAEPMKQSIIAVRQLMQALQKMQNSFYRTKDVKE
jgi:hypothetical protein